MSSNSQFPAAQNLIQAFSDISSTEELILYVAGTDNMLSFCQDLIEQYDRENLVQMTLEVNSLCAKHGILPGLLYSEIRKVLIAVNRFHDAGQDHYATLGLQKNASVDQVKKTYRQLSKHYHPDVMQNKDNDAQRFMEIAGAYHAIMATLTDTQLPGDKPWRRKSKNPKVKRRLKQKRFLLTFIPIILALTVISFYASMKYDENVVRSQIEGSTASSAYSKEHLQPVKVTPPPPTPPSDDFFVQKTANAQVPETFPPSPAAEPEKQVAASSKVIATTLNPSVQSKVDLATVEEIPSPEIAEPVSVEPEITGAEQQVNEDPVPPSIAAAPEQQPPVEQVAQVNHVEKVEKGEDVQPEQNIAPDQESLSAPEEQPEQIDPKLAIKGILAEYVNLYNSQDLENLFALFKKDAKENGRLQTDLIDQYTSLFANTKAIELYLETIDIHEYKNGFEAKSKFSAFYSYKNGRSEEHNGDITFYFTDEQGRLKIQSMDYVFVK